MSATNLTDAKIAGLKAVAEGRFEVADKLVPGLRVRVGTSGAKTFILRKRVGGRISNITLGRYGVRFTLSDARKKARTLLSDIDAGGDPRTETRNMAKTSGGTVRALFAEYQKAKASRRSIGEIRRIFEKYILPEIGDRLADSLNRADVTRLVDGIEAPVMARGVAAQLSAFYTWAMPRLHRLNVNPCRDAGKPEKPKARERVLTSEELRALWEVLDSEGLPWGPGIKLLVLTGQRRDEVFSASRSEFDLTERLWSIPAARAKNGKAHLVPLCSTAVALLHAVPEIAGTPKLFPARSRPQNGPSGFSKALARIQTAMGEKLGELEHFTLHDLRRTLATGLQRLGIRIEVTEAVLNHVGGTRAGIVGVYQRHDFLEEKRQALEAWAAEIELIVSQPSK